MIDDTLAILFSDAHLSHRPPGARCERDWYPVMDRQLSQIRQLQKQHDCITVVAGDVFDGYRPEKCPAELVNFALSTLPDRLFGVPGNHELPGHRLDDLRKSPFCTLQKAGKIQYLSPNLPQDVSVKGSVLRLHGFPWGIEVRPRPKNPTGSMTIDVAVIHAYVWKPGAGHLKADPNDLSKNWRKRLEGYDVAHFGDNHQLVHTCRDGLTIFNCLLPGNWIGSKNVEAASRSFYHGQAVEVRTNSGLAVRTTINHPILTPDGFIAAGRIKKGQKLLSSTGKISSLTDENKDYRPSKVEDVFGSLEALSIGGRAVGRPAVDDFHGDAAFIQGDVEVVSPGRELLFDFKSGDFKNVGNLEFHRRHVQAPFEVAGSRSLRHRLIRIFRALTGVVSVGFSRPCNLLLGGKRGPMTAYPFGSSLSRRRIRELAFGILRNCAQSHTGVEEDSFDPICLSSFPRSAPHGDAEAFREFLHANSGQIKVDDVVGVRHFDYSGPVFDFQTTTGLILTNQMPSVNSLLVSNSGGLFRRRMDEIDNRPCVGLLKRDGKVERHYLDVSEDKFLDAADLPADVKDTSGFEEVVELLTTMADMAADFDAAVRWAVDKINPSERVRQGIFAALDKSGSKK